MLLITCRSEAGSSAALPHVTGDLSRPMAVMEDATYHRGVPRDDPAGEGRSTAIVLFTDLVASTALRSGLGDVAAEEIRRRHDRLVSGAVNTNRGRVVKNLGDGVMAAF